MHGPAEADLEAARSNESADPSDRTAAGAAGPLATAAAAYLGWCLLLSHMWMDDAFISFRYAEHLADGIGPIWNPADREQPVEGFTSFLHVYLLAALRVLTGLRIADLAQPLCIALGLGTLVSLSRALSARGVSGPATWLALSPFLLPFAALVSVSGMETTLAMFLSLHTALACVRFAEREQASALYTFLLCAMLTTLTRPEFALGFAGLSLYLFVRVPGARLRMIVAGLLLYALPGAITMLIRWQTFHALLPQPFHVKQSGLLEIGGKIYVVRYLLLLALPFVLPIAARLPVLWARERVLTAVALGINGLYALYFATTIPLMGDFYRYLIINLPILALLSAVACSLPSTSGNATGLGATIRRKPLTVALGLLALSTLAQAPAWYLISKNYDRGISHYRTFGRLLRPYAAEGRWLIYHDVGALVYESDFNTIDVVGLNTVLDPTRRSPCLLKTDLVLRSYSHRRGHTLNPCTDADRHKLGLPAADAPGQPRYLTLVDLPKTEEAGQTVDFFRLFARDDIPYAEALKADLLAGWPGPRPKEPSSRPVRAYMKAFYKM